MFNQVFIVMTDLSQVIERFIKNRGNVPVDFKVEMSKYNQYFVSIYVDWSRMDKNNPNFDQSYYDLFGRDGTGFIAALVPRKIQTKYFTPILKEIVNLLDLKRDSWKLGYLIKNYEYIENYEPKIKEAIEGTSFPTTRFEFTGDWDEPHIRILFGNKEFKVGSSDPSLSRENTKKFEEELEINLSGILDLSSFRFAFTNN